MKLRIRDNSIRLRITRPEVETLHGSGLLTAATHFAGGSRFEYSVESTPASVAPGATFEGARLLVRVPESAVAAWAESDEVTIRGEQPLDDGGTLVILVEKDFACLAPRDGEDESDMFEHPEAGQRLC